MSPDGLLDMESFCWWPAGSPAASQSRVLSSQQTQSRSYKYCIYIMCAYE